MFAVIHVPNFWLQAALRGDAEAVAGPVALVNDESTKPSIIQLNRAAREAGVTEGMTATQAIARCPQARFLRRSPAQEQIVGDALLQCAFSFSPKVEATGDGSCTLDLAGFRDLDRLATGKRMVDRAGSLQLEVQVGFAEHPDLAWLAAQQAQPVLLATDARAFVSALRVEQLKPSQEALSILMGWGITTVGALLELDRTELAERLGSEAATLREQISGTTVRPLRLVQPPEVFAESMDFEREIETVEPLLFVLRRMIEQLSARLEIACNATHTIRLELTLANNTRYERSIEIPAPTRDFEKLFRALQTHLETVRTAHPIIGLRLSMAPARELTHQFGLFETAVRDPNQFQETLARLNGLLGPARVGTPVLADTHRADAFQMVPPTFSFEDSIASRPRRRHRMALPLHRFRPPIAATVETGAESPQFVKCSIVEGPIRKAFGPWRTNGTWWEGQGWGAEEWDIETSDGGLYRLSKQKDNWLLEGAYD